MKASKMTSEQKKVARAKKIERRKNDKIAQASTRTLRHTRRETARVEFKAALNAPMTTMEIVEMAVE